MKDFLNNIIIKNDMIEIRDRQNDISWLNGKSVLITGAYGMLASYMVYFLIYINEEIPDFRVDIIAQGRKPEKMCERFGDYIKQEYFTTIYEDICNPLNIEHSIDYVVHAASLASSQFYNICPVDVLKPNCLGTCYLLEMCRSHDIKSFLFFSSGDVYGELPSKERMYHEEDYGYLDCMNIRSCYGESKRMGETICKSYFQQYQIPTKIVRIAHTYGPTMDIENDKRVFSEFVHSIVNNENIQLKSDGQAVRMFCYVTDAVDAFLKILKCGEPGEAYNMYNNSQIMTIFDLAHVLIDLFPDKGLNVEKSIRSNASLYMESPVKIAPKMSTTKLQKLNWKPLIDIKEGFTRTILSFS